MLPRDLTREFVSGGGFNWYGSFARALPQAIDDLTTDFGADVYEKMLLDAQVSACITILKASILEDGISLEPAVDDATDPRYGLAMEIRDEAEAMLDGLDVPLDDALWNVLDALCFGNVVSELKYELRPGSTEAGKRRTMLQLAALKPKPRHATAFVVDAYLNVVGLIGARAGQANALLPGAVIDPATDPNILPREKFAVLTFRPKNGDPRGSSVLRAAYHSWWVKQQLKPEYLKYLSQFAGPSVWATTPEGASYRPPADSLGNPTTVKLDATTGLPTTSPEMQMLTALLAWRNGTATVFPFGSVVHPIEMQGHGQPFLLAIALCDVQITKAILTQSLATEEAEHQTRAAAIVHQDVLDTLVRQGKHAVVRMIQRDVLRPWVEYNWGPEAAEALVPKPSLGQTEEQDRAPLITAIASLFSSGYLDPSQLPGLDTMLGLSVRDLTPGPGPETGPATTPDGQPVPSDGQGSAPERTGPAVPPPAGPAASGPPAPPNPRIPVRGHERNRPARKVGMSAEDPAEITPEDEAAAVIWWKRHAPENFRALLDAEAG